MLNNFFKSMFTIDDGIVHHVTSRVEEADTLSSVTFEPQSVSRILKNLNPNASCGPDGIKPIFLSTLRMLSVDLLLFYLNVCF